MTLRYCWQVITIEFATATVTAQVTTITGPQVVAATNVAVVATELVTIAIAAIVATSTNFIMEVTKIAKLQLVIIAILVIVAATIAAGVIAIKVAVSPKYVAHSRLRLGAAWRQLTYYYFQANYYGQ